MLYYFIIFESIVDFLDVVFLLNAFKSWFLIYALVLESNIISDSSSSISVSSYILSSICISFNYYSTVFYSLKYGRWMGG